MQTPGGRALSDPRRRQPKLADLVEGEHPVLTGRERRNSPVKPRLADFRDLCSRFSARLGLARHYGRSSRKKRDR